MPIGKKNDSIMQEADLDEIKEGDNISGHVRAHILIKKDGD